MKSLTPIKGILFDYGGTLDTNGAHWANVIWRAYQQTGILIKESEFKEAYIHAERSLALQPHIKPEYHFGAVMRVKIALQFDYLESQSFLNVTSLREEQVDQVATICYQFAKKQTLANKPLLERLQKRYKMGLVSNFYGNIKTVVTDFEINEYFCSIVESAVVGVRKPNPAIFLLGADELELLPDEIVVVGDSFSKDILPATQAGFQTIWLKGAGWNEETDDTVPTAIISSLDEIEHLLLF